MICVFAVCGLCYVKYIFGDNFVVVVVVVSCLDVF